MWQKRELDRLQDQLPVEIEVYGSVAAGDFDEFSDLDIRIRTTSGFEKIINIITNDRKIFGEEIYKGNCRKLFRFWLEDGKRYDITLFNSEIDKTEKLELQKSSDSKKFWFLLVIAAHKFIRKDSFISIDLYLKPFQMVLDKQWDKSEKVRTEVEKIIRKLSFDEENFIENLAKIGKCWSIISRENEQLETFQKQYLK